MALTARHRRTHDRRGRNPGIIDLRLVVLSPAPGSLLWFRADDAILDGTQVTQLNDRSGNNRHATASSLGSLPTIELNSINGKPSVFFDGASAMATAAISPAIAQPRTVFLVAQLTSTGTSHFMDGNSLGVRTVVGRNSGKLWIRTDISLTSANQVSQTPYIIYRAVFNDAASFMFMNSLQVGSGSAGSHALDGLVLGASYSGTSKMTGRISEVIVYQAIAQAEIEATESYLKERYAIA